ncbi:antibiotic biosynthesis monooxygenase [Marinobacteraceae bacterium S3BR75-40.1]
MDSIPKPPYYAVIFTSTLAPDDHGYDAMAQAMVDLASQQPGFLGIDSARETVGITVSYWRSLEDIQRWKENAEHREAQRLGRTKWYASYQLHIAKVERSYSFQREGRSQDVQRGTES